MTLLTYNYNQNGVECIIVIKNNKILDISILKNTNYDSKEEMFHRGSKSIISYISDYDQSDNIRILYPPMLSGNLEEKIILNKTDKNNVSFGKKPLKLCSAINYMVDYDKISKVSYNNINSPIKIYTDASVQDNRQPTIAYGILNNKNEILSLNARILSGNKNIEDYELIAGVAGLSDARCKGFDDVIWISDNQRAQDVLQGVDKVGTSTQRLTMRDLRNKFKIFEYRDIRGKDNHLADSLASDVRKEEIGRYISYTSPAIKNI